ncbi:hypothetical protein AX14_005449 [Amanita brunnescens Koide BX004]|nr:hypothetical protein AX14_005449 [Amanita brunnescens Koide BX004]
MQPETTSASCTILRIKRKRNEEPLDALVVESRVRRKKSRGGMDVFQFAQTVEDDAWKDDKMKKVIEDEISRLTREASSVEEAKVAKGTVTDKPKPPAVRQRRGDNNRRYTILEHDAVGSKPQARPKKPATVISSKDVTTSNVKMYDAIPSPVKSRPSVESDIEKFLPLLNDYLSLHDMLPNSSERPKEQRAVTPSALASGTATDDYVWDIFYRRPGATDEWADKVNVATLTGLPSYENLYDSDSESELEDEGDVDSNAEEHYKNDYPEEEELSDEFHEQSEFEESFLRDEDDYEEELF